MKRKLLMTFGSLTSLITPIAALSCSCSSKSSEQVTTTITNPPVEPKPTIEPQPPVTSNKNTFVAPYDFESPLVKIKNNMAYIDQTREKLQDNEEDQRVEISHFFASVKEVFETIDNYSSEEIKPFIDWVNTKALDYPFVKIAYRFYYKGNIDTIVHKWVINTEEKEWQKVQKFYEDGEASIMKNSNSIFFKLSTNIEDFYNPKW